MAATAGNGNPIGRRAQLVQGNLHLHGWVYKIETGEVFAFDPAVGQFVPMAEYKARAEPTRAHTIRTI